MTRSPSSSRTRALILCLLMLLPSAAAHAAEFVSDSLVDHLNCASLSRDSVLSRLQPDAFSVERQIPIQNWQAAVLAECWSLSHAQRLLYYLGRFGEASDNGDEIRDVLDLFGGKTPIEDASVFRIEESGRFFQQLLSGVPGEIGLTRNFKVAIQLYQRFRFSEPDNLQFLEGERDRSKAENSATFEAVASDLARNRLPLVILRPALQVQHVVLIKRMEPDPERGSYRLDVYDSNFPYKENHLVYSELEREFRAPEIVSAFKDPAPKDPVGVFLVDDGDMDRIQDALVAHYSRLCEK